VAEIPELNAAARRYADDGLVIIAADVDEPADRIARFVERQGIEYTVLVDPLSVTWHRYSAIALPTTVWIDADGIFRGADQGALTEDRIEKAMEKVLEPYGAR